MSTPDLSLNLDLDHPRAAFRLIGFPWDQGAFLGRPGARYGPEAIRKALRWNLNRIRDGRVWDLEGGRVVDLTAVRLVDGGDVPMAYHDREATFARVEASVHECLERGEVPIVLGGDHSISLPPITALARAAGGPIGVLQLDAHLDLVDDSPVQGRFSHSSQMRRALELPELAPGRLVQIGLRGLNYPEYAGFCASHGILQFSAPQAERLGPEAVAEQALAAAGAQGARVYLTLDIDALTPMAAPGAGYLEFNGLSVGFVSRFLRLVAPHVVAFDVAEVNPLFDVQEMTAILAAKLIMDFIIGKVVG